MAMKLWRLDMTDHEHNDHYQDGCHNYADGHYVIAETEAQARAMIDDPRTPGVWGNPEYSACEEIDMTEPRYLTCEYDVH
jgi:hypothetical protein